jgi:RNA polymerase sigma factor (sigma-70 family)
MARGQLGQAIGYLRRVIGGPGSDATDLQLLQCYAATKQDEAFTTLVRRHGAMVLGVCRRVLGNNCDADDAFQATFLVLARKAGSVPWRESIGNWLYGVAYRIASKQRGERARRSGHERAAGARRSEATTENPAALELQQVLDEELARMPEKFRMPLLLCCLQDQTLDEAGQQLGWSFATVKGRLQRGRDALRHRLRGRGVTLSAGVLATILAPSVVQAVPLHLLNSTCQSAATRTMTAPVAALVKGAMQAMFWMKMKTATMVLTAICAIGVGTALGMHWTGQPGQLDDPAAVPNVVPAQKKVENEPLILGNKDDGKIFKVPIGTVIEVRLEGKRNNVGWEASAVKGELLLYVNRDKTQPGEKPSRPGLQPLPFGGEFSPEPAAEDKAIGTYIFIFKAAKVGRAELDMQYVTPGGPGVKARARSAVIARYHVTIDVNAADGANADLTDAEKAALARQAADKDKLSVHASIMIYSGREDPSWQLTPAQAKEFLERFKGLAKTIAPEEKGGLGYRGFYLQVSGEGFGGIEGIAVLDGFVRTHGKGAEQAFEDKDLALEKWLLVTAKDTLDAPLYKALAAALKIEEPKTTKAELTDQQMAALAKEAAQKAKAAEIQDIRSENPDLGKWRIEHPLVQSQFWCIVHEYTNAAPVRSYIAVNRDGVLSTYKSENFAKFLDAEVRGKWTDTDYLHAASLYIHLTDTPNQDGWKIVKTPAEFMAIEFNMAKNEKQRRQTAQAIAMPTVMRDKDTVRVRLWSWHLIGGVLREWNVTFAPNAFKAESKELGHFGGGGYD